MKLISHANYYNMSKGYRGEWTEESVAYRAKDFEGVENDWIGKRTMLYFDSKHGTTLITEGFHFEIVGKHLSKIPVGYTLHAYHPTLDIQVVSRKFSDSDLYDCYEDIPWTDKYMIFINGVEDLGYSQEYTLDEIMETYHYIIGVDDNVVNV